MNQEELKELLIDLIEQPMPMMSGNVTYGEMRMPEYQARFIANNLIENGVTIRERGEWTLENGLYHCSNCGTTCPYDANGDVIEYWTCCVCPVCGADMRGVTEPPEAEKGR